MTLKLGRHEFADDATLMMAIVNRTPDSFYDKGATWAEDKAFDRVAQVVDQGAEIVDIGGIKAAPGVEIDAAEEIAPRRRLRGAGPRRRYPDLVICVDTWRAEVGRAVCAGGADVLNDAWGGADPELVDVAAEYGAAIICTHTGGVTSAHPPLPDRVRRRGRRRDRRHRRLRRAGASAAGVAREAIVIDPAHDFGKNTFHSLELTRRLGEMVDTGWPVLVSLSNKDFVGETPRPARRGAADRHPRRDRGLRAGRCAGSTGCTRSSRPGRSSTWCGRSPGGGCRRARSGGSQ